MLLLLSSSVSLSFQKCNIGFFADDVGGGGVLGNDDINDSNIADEVDDCDDDDDDDG